MAAPKTLKSQGSFVEQVSLNSKADKLFGLDQKDDSIKPQKEGYLWKKPFAFSRTSGITSLQRKRYFAVKDSFIFWWDSEWKSEVGFDTKPRGAIPLGGASIRCLPDKVTLELRHPVFNKGEVLIMKAADAFEANEWHSAIQAGMQATWENAILGFAMIDKMKAKGSELESEKEDAVVKAEKEATRLQQEREEAQKMADLREQQAQLHEEEVAKVESAKTGLIKQVSLKEEEVTSIVNETEQERKKREELELEMLEAHEALSEIEAIFEAFEEERIREQIQIEEKEREELEKKQRAKSMIPPTVEEQAEMARQALETSEERATKFDDEEQVKKNVAALRTFFEATAREHEMRRANLQVKGKD